MDITLASLEPADITAFYNRLANSAPVTGLLLRQFSDIHPGRSLCKPQVSENRHKMMGMALHAKLAAPGVLPPADPDALGMIQQHSHESDGFHLLHQLMHQAHPLPQPLLSADRPKWPDSENVCIHAAHWQRHFENEAAQ